MDKIILMVHVLAALAIIGLILLQQGKGAAMGASFGSGASQTVFGSQGGGGFFARATAIVAALFFITSFSLAVIAKNKSEISDNAGLDLPMVEEVPIVDDVPANDVPVSDVPVIEDTSDVPAVEDTSAPPADDAQATEEIPVETP